MAADETGLNKPVLARAPGPQRMFSYSHTSPLIFLLLAPITVAAAPVININNIYYNVSGETAEDIWTDIMKKSPVMQNGKQHVAYTRWYVNWSFWWVDKVESCEISGVSVSLDITYTLPKLTQNTSMTDALSNHWQNYYSALYRHEQGHKDFGVKAAEQIETELAAMAARPDCSQLEREANAAANRILDKFRQIEIRYDQSTNHGLSTGAVFP